MAFAYTRDQKFDFKKHCIYFEEPKFIYSENRNMIQIGKQ